MRNSKLEDLWDSIRIPFKSGLRRVMRLIAWLPVIWMDEDWEPESLFNIMKFKISRLRQPIERNKCVSRWQKIVREMKVAEELCSRLGNSDFYHDNQEKLVMQFCSCPDYGEFLKDESRFTPIYNSHGEIVAYRQDKHFPYCSFCEVWNFKLRMKDKKEKEDMRFLFELLNKKLRTWWD